MNYCIRLQEIANLMKMGEKEQPMGMVTEDTVDCESEVSMPNEKGTQCDSPILFDGSTQCKAVLKRTIATQTLAPRKRKARRRKHKVNVPSTPSERKPTVQCVVNTPPPTCVLWTTVHNI